MAEVSREVEEPASCAAGGPLAVGRLQEGSISAHHLIPGKLKSPGEKQDVHLAFSEGDNLI